MAYDVKFLKGTASKYTAISVKDANTFYFTTDDNQLYLGEIKLSNAGDIAAAILRIAKNEQDITTINESLATITGEGDGSIKKAVADAKTELEGKIGDISTLNTTAKTNVVAAINELKQSIGATESGGVVSIEEGSSEDYAKVYTVKQGSATVGTINIPKDMVVSSGKVVVNPEGQTAGTYIELTLANATSDKIYVNVASLVDIYTAKAGAAEIQVAIDSSTREISATIVNGAVGTEKLAAAAVTTEKIADGNVTLIKLSTDVRASLAKADSALQASDIASGTENGSIAVKGTDVKVTGLKSAAFAETTAFDQAGAAATAKSEAIAYIDEALTWGSM